MPSRFEDEQAEDFLARLNRPLRWMPPPVRQELHAELRQHLDALVAAHEELGSTPEEAFDLALRQFGDPAKIGRKLWWEWLRGTKPCVGPACQAALYALMVYVACDFLLLGLPSLLTPDGQITPGCLQAALQSSGGFFSFLQSRLCGAVMSFLLVAGIPLLAGFTAGRKFPRQGIQAAMWISLAPLVWLLPALGLCVFPFAQDTPWLIPIATLFSALFGGLGAVGGGLWATRKRKRFSRTP